MPKRKRANMHPGLTESFVLDLGVFLRQRFGSTLPARLIRAYCAALGLLRTERGHLVTATTFHVAVAEDSPSDLAWFQDVLAGLGFQYKLTVAEDGEEARDFILKQGKYRGFPPADVIFLDMSMPKLTGLEVLLQIPRSAELPVCVLTTSERERESINQHFYPKKINYISKPIDRDKLLQCLRSHESLAEQLATR